MIPEIALILGIIIGLLYPRKKVLYEIVKNDNMKPHSDSFHIKIEVDNHKLLLTKEVIEVGEQRYIEHYGNK